ncbi:MAG TPA: Ig-like domain-containing protein, partial [Candidatus Krumholzibacteria bacterium]|nr:Ig-like domain-containing protein [Candidatus Krumholzibacteria bacterium]
TGTVALGVTAVNDAPTAANDAYALDEDVVLTMAAPGVRGNDTDIEGDTLTVSVATPPAHGTLVLAADGSFTYTPALDFFGTDSFTYTVRDPSGASDTGVANLTIRGINDSPKGADVAFVTEEDIAVHSGPPGVLRTASDADDDPLSASLVTPPLHGALELGPDGAFVYTPATDYFGDDGFVYEVTDGHGGRAGGTVGLTVLPVQDPPVVVEDAHVLDEDGSLEVVAPGLLANDSDVDGDVLESRLRTPPAHGVLRVESNGAFTYTPAPDFNGTDTFTYVADDGNGGTNQATVTLTVRPVNDLPVAADDAFGTAEDAALTVSGPGLLANDSDLDGDVTAARAGTSPVHGTLRLQPDGGFVYEPAPDYHGPDTFTYIVEDGRGGSASAMVRLDVTPAPDAPATAADTFTGDEDTELSVGAPGVLSNDLDVDGDPLHAVLLEQAAHGEVVLDADGSFRYLPAPDWHGTDLFTYAADDGTGRSTTAAVTVTLAPVNDAPTAALDAYDLAEDAVFVIDAPGVLGNDADMDGEILHAEVQTTVAHGALALRADGSFTYTPAPDYYGPDAFTYNARDAAGATASATVRFQIAPVNDAPLPADDAWSVAEDDTLTVSSPGPLGNDRDVEGDPLAAALVVPPTHGVVTLAADGAFLYAPAPDFSGEDRFTYAARDPSGAARQGTALLRVTPVNDAPDAVPDAYTVVAGGSTTFAAPGLLGNDVDTDGDSLQAVLVESPRYGHLDLQSDGSFVYTPLPGFTGSDGFTYRTSDGLESDIAAVRLQVDGRGVTYRESASGTVSASTEVATTTTLVAVPGDLYLATISSRPFRAVLGLEGMNLTWTRVRSQCGAGGETGLELWMARGEPVSAVVTASLAAPAEQAVVAVSRYSGVDPMDPLGTIVAGNSQGLEADCSSGAESADYDWRLATLTEGGILFRAVTMRDRGHTSTDGSFLRQRAGSGALGGMASVEVQDRAVDAGEHAQSGVLSAAVDWAAVAVEIRSAHVDEARLAAERLEVLPNPFIEHSLVRTMLFRRAPVRIDIFDARGRRVRQLLDDVRPPGRMQVDFIGTDDRGRRLDSGVYFMRLQSEGRTITRKVVLLK